MAALMMTALLGFLALVLDVGNGLAQRRFMQNAADAAAVAGARYLAQNRGTATDAGTMAAMTPYLSGNGSATLAAPTGPATGAWYVQINGSTVGPVNQGSIPSSAWGVRVNATKTFPTFFASVLGHATMTATARATAIYGAASNVLLNWRLTGMPVMPLAFDAYYYDRMIASSNCTYGKRINFRQPVDWPSECTVDEDAHFGFSMLNIGNDCSNQTTKDVLDRLANRPETLDGISISVGTDVMVCSGSRDTTWDYIIQGRPVLVPIIDHATASTCNSNCYARITNFAYVQFEQKAGHGSHSYLQGFWVNPQNAPPLPGLQISTNPTTIVGPVTYALSG